MLQTVKKRLIENWYFKSLTKLYSFCSSLHKYNWSKINSLVSKGGNKKNFKCVNKLEKYTFTKNVLSINNT